MELTSFMEIFTLVLGMLVFVYVIAWVFQGTTEDDREERRPMQHPKLAPGKEVVASQVGNR